MNRTVSIFVGLLVLLPLPAFAFDGFPSFPMAFWGNVTINGTVAPVGSVVNAYYGSTLAGTATVQEAGIYGYTEPAKQKLTIGEGTGVITFKVISSGFNSGSETAGDSSITQAAFTSGLTVQKDLAFTLTPPVTTGGGSGGGSSGGGGGGGGGVTYNYAVSINNGAADTSSTSVTLSLSPTANANQMQISNTSDFSTSTWLTFQSTYPWVLTSGSGVKVVYVRYGSNSSVVATAQDSINLTDSKTVPAVTTQTQVQAPVQPQVLGASAYNFTTSLTIGSHGEAVTQLQQFLTNNGFYTGPITGYFGGLTEAAVKALQAKNGITPVSGFVGPKTLALLNKGTAPSTPEVVSATSSYTFTRTLSVGSTGAEVTALQDLLAKISGYTGSTTGYFGVLTRAAVEKYQTEHNLSPVGIVGPQTRSLLNRGI